MELLDWLPFKIKENSVKPLQKGMTGKWVGWIIKSKTFQVESFTL
jgi:hypothetical protein